MIRKVGGKYVLYSRRGGRRLGTHRTRKAAIRQERAIQISKARRAGYDIPRRNPDWGPVPELLAGFLIGGIAYALFFPPQPPSTSI